jgi:ADP-heptose:LPS heptosyltransferase
MMLEKVSKIGIIEPMNLGDLLCSVPLFRSLRRAWPAAEIVLIGDGYIVPFFDRFRHYLDRLFCFDIDIEWGNEQDIQPFVDSVSRERFDLLLKLYFWLGKKPETTWWDEHYPARPQPDGSVRSGVSQEEFWEAHLRSIRLASSLGARVTAGIADVDAPRPNSFIGVPHVLSQHVVHTMLNVARALGVPLHGDELEFPLVDEEHLQAAQLLDSHGIRRDLPLVGIHVGANASFRQWPIERFATVADALIDKYGVGVVFTGVDSEHALIARAIDAMERREHAYDFSGKTDLGMLAAILDRMALYITNNTGAHHVAVARRTPSITIFGHEREAAQWAGLDRHLHRALVASGGGEALPLADAIRSIEPYMVMDEVESLKYQLGIG